MPNTAVDVVILTWNDGVLLDEAIRSVENSVGVETQIFVVDNGSTPPAEVPSHVHLIRSDTNLGVSAGRNRGIAAGKNEYVLILDSDAQLTPRALCSLMAPLIQDETIALTVPVFTDQEPEESAGRAPTLRRKLQRARNQTNLYEAMQRSDSDPYWDVDFGIGACQLFRRSTWTAVNGIDESFFYGPEDVDFCLRVKQQSGRVVQVQDSTVSHPPRRRFRGIATQRGIAHAWAIARFLWRHRQYDEHLPQSPDRSEAYAQQ